MVCAGGTDVTAGSSPGVSPASSAISSALGGLPLYRDIGLLWPQRASPRGQGSGGARWGATNEPGGCRPRFPGARRRDGQALK